LTNNRVDTLLVPAVFVRAYQDYRSGLVGFQLESHGTHRCDLSPHCGGSPAIQLRESTTMRNSVGTITTKRSTTTQFDVALESEAIDKAHEAKEQQEAHIGNINLIKLQECDSDKL
jgi:hypothetical protein